MNIAVVALAVVARRKRWMWLYVAALTVPGLLILAFLVWSLLGRVPPPDAHPWLFFLSKWLGIVLFAMVLIESLFSARRRWLRKRTSEDRE